MNKKLIIGLIVAGVVIGGAIYFYNRNKKSTSAPSKEMATEQDALKVADILGKKDSPMDAGQLKKWVPAYTSTISKADHDGIVKVINKPESSWSSADKLLFEKVVAVINQIR